MKKLYSFFVEYNYLQFAGVVSSDSEENAKIKVQNYIVSKYRYGSSCFDLDTIVIEELNAEKLDLVEILSRDMCS